MKMLNVLFVGVSLIIGTTSASAQETVQERADKHTKQMTKTLALSSDQVAKVAELNLGVAYKNEVIRNDANLTPDRKKEYVKGNIDGRKTQLQMILTPEQYLKFEEQEANRIENKAEKKEKKQNTIQPNIEVLEEL
jgi:hypothetical protein